MSEPTLQSSPTPPLPSIDHGVRVTLSQPHLADSVIYVSEVQVPWHHRGWAWGLAGAAILLSGLGIGWLLKPDRLITVHDDGAAVTSTADAPALLDIQRGVNEGLRDQVRRLEKVTDVCQPDLPEGIGRILGQPQSRPVESGHPPNPSQPPTQSDRPSTANNLTDLLEAATVHVIALASPSKGFSGSGFFVSDDIVITNAHVVNGASPDRIFIQSKSLNKIYRAKLLTMTGGVDTGKPGERDYAILRVVDAHPKNHFILSPTISKLDVVKVAGYPEVYTKFDPAEGGSGQGEIPEMVMRSGEVSVIHEFVPGIPVISHTASIFHGNSGGPLVDGCGRVVGVNTFVIAPRDSEGEHENGERVKIDFSIGAKDLIRYLEESGTRIGETISHSDSVCH